jgi:ribonucleases P/MRP protein subunit RPP40
MLVSDAPPVVKYQLRDSAMLHGKKGFDRLLYACKNVLNKPLIWQFCNLQSSCTCSGSSLGQLPELMQLPAHNPDLLSEQHATDFTTNPRLSSLLTAVPDLKPPTEVIAKGDVASFEELATDIYEWISLVRLDSPRIQAGDNIDSHVSRYQVPGGSAPSNVCRISWGGFLAPNWAREVLVEALLSLPSKVWFSLSATSQPAGLVADSTDFTFVRPPNSPGEYLLWEVDRTDQ